VLGLSHPEALRSNALCLAQPWTVSGEFRIHILGLSRNVVCMSIHTLNW
jgi:hypothetical protein